MAYRFWRWAYDRFEWVYFGTFAVGMSAILIWAWWTPLSVRATDAIAIPCMLLLIAGVFVLATLMNALGGDNGTI